MSFPALHIDTLGSQGQDIVLLHGWGVNNQVFSPLKSALHQYRVHYVDLPGFGLSGNIDGDITQWSQTLAAQLPQQAIWIGWSLGGLIASQIAIDYPESVAALVTIASSPCFMSREANELNPTWPGIQPDVLAQFSSQLSRDLTRTVERFLAIQAMGSDNPKADIQQIKSLVLSKPLPTQQGLSQGLDMLAQVDLRTRMAQIQQPWLRIWGKLDSLVPRKIISALPQSDSIEDVVLHKASHAPFISHPELFLSHLLPWIIKYSQK
ncbi:MULTISPECIES: pimeloyl-ACP methyl ester esterase BioH [Shewanella]|uniref:pimeloyl-ACP methyl ester esterase BioH n=1 Tax=Shewanella TaxID=22 RepID=UPI000C50AEFD|nr:MULTISPECIES: pimeloyl-ACP methyl ester esterase BioH [Shewanella]NCQ46448.1 pimeloyl-ACP methyl ester esterase BioH [Shewanella frigidimarina]NCO72345.1 pimeloyl-ACP methyl ester esterase BioH [Shewanella vesiculosa]NCP38347.1 pimeloyl-ACP methyl ester esterase BioH [Shewanella vesiculosa]NCP70374.1 pimeloyl-ACP methyl ester esterase BioH [Shewanella vesiculosa]NCP75801.1 pimeloyl-ACP methyl ester esterase BioH [Shewanella vesiculosa]